VITVVVGTGIVRTAIAHDLQKRWRPVLLFDRDRSGNAGSAGNLALQRAIPSHGPQRLSWLRQQRAAFRLAPRSRWLASISARSLPLKGHGPPRQGGIPEPAMPAFHRMDAASPRAPRHCSDPFFKHKDKGLVLRHQQWSSCLDLCCYHRPADG
jgi:hypothetical protein